MKSISQYSSVVYFSVTCVTYGWHYVYLQYLYLQYITFLPVGFSIVSAGLFWEIRSAINKTTIYIRMIYHVCSVTVYCCWTDIFQGSYFFSGLISIIRGMYDPNRCVSFWRVFIWFCISPGLLLKSNPFIFYLSIIFICAENTECHWSKQKYTLWDLIYWYKLQWCLYYLDCIQICILHLHLLQFTNVPILTTKPTQIYSFICIYTNFSEISVQSQSTHFIPWTLPHLFA